MPFYNIVSDPIHTFFGKSELKYWNECETLLCKPNWSNLPPKQPEASLCVHILPVKLNLETTAVSPAAVHHHLCKRENHN